MGVQSGPTFSASGEFVYYVARNGAVMAQRVDDLDSPPLEVGSASRITVLDLAAG
jgi:hypothetical protein